MKISEMTIGDLKGYSHVYHEEDDSLFMSILLGVKGYIKSYTGLSNESVDLKEDLTMAFYVIASEMYDNRSFTVTDDKINPMVKSILDMHSINLL